MAPQLCCSTPQIRLEVIKLHSLSPDILFLPGAFSLEWKGLYRNSSCAGAKSFD
jgi:hypothetical protein